MTIHVWLNMRETGVAPVACMALWEDDALFLKWRRMNSQTMPISGPVHREFKSINAAVNYLVNMGAELQTVAMNHSGEHSSVPLV